MGLTPARLRAGDLLRESALSTLRHPGRSLVTVVGTVLGAAAYVSTLGLGATMSGQVSSVFDARRATEVIVQPEDAGLDPSWSANAGERLARLTGVVRAGSRVAVGERPLRRTLDASTTGAAVPVIGADADALRVMGPALTSGRLFDRFHDERRVPVVLLSAPVAAQLAVTRVGVAVFIGDAAYTVIGIYGDVARREEAMAAAIVPHALGERLVTDGTAARDVLIETAPGAAQVVGRQAPLAVRPEAAGDLRAIAPPDPRTLRREIEGDLTRSTLVLSLIALVIGTISIGNAATAAIAVRAPEIGLRRALGARPRHVFVQLVTETSLLGAAGGAAGALLGVLVVSVVALANAWTPSIDVRAALVACAASTAAGLLAGLWPAARAVRIPPVQALQRGP
ncbi:ABC transporter permease [Paractinoplanes rishiriensis]|uniref:ABC transporter permease n=2 Tax=Paractinoplanes rishiriensis TaxID=1050105 RepID=A0A919JVH7_9ACTN|nr:ABC transporter permease [Actinoplanes rishiriensis]